MESQTRAPEKRARTPNAPDQDGAGGVLALDVVRQACAITELEYLSPIDYENLHTAAQTAA